MKLGLLRAYRTVGVNPDRYLKYLRRVYGLHITSFHEMKTVPLPVVDYLSDKTIRTSTKIAMLDGAGAGWTACFQFCPMLAFWAASPGA